MNSLKNFIKNNFKHLIYFYNYLGYRVFIRIGLSIVVGLLDGFGLAMFLPLLQMIDGKAVVENEGLGNLSFFVEGLNALGIELNLISILSVLSFFFIFKGIVMYINDAYETVVRESFMRKIRIKITNDLSNLSYKSFVSADVGRIQNTFTSEVIKISDAYKVYFDVLQQTILILVYTLFAFFVDASFALLISLGGILTNYLFKRIFTITKEISSKLTDTFHRYQGLIIQFVANYKYLRASGSINKVKNIVIGTIRDIEKDYRRIGKLHAVIIAAREPLLIVVVGAVIYLKIHVFGGNLAPILMSLVFFYRALSSSMQLQNFYNHFISLTGSLYNMTTFERDLESNQEKDGTMRIDQFKETIKLDNVSFQYDQKPVLNGLSFSIDKNETIAFIGESGSGKTTLVNLIVGLLMPDSGSISVDGKDMKEINKESFRNRVGYITQEPVIFNDTIFDNITLWDAPTEANYKRFYKILKQSSLDVFISELPNKEKTLLGNNGINISGGQKQRISIARELYKDIDIMILDEATSALDSETEQNIQQHVDMLKGKLTILIVAHRLSTIRNANKIVLLKDGQIVDANTFNNLRETSPLFRKMLDLQQF